MSETTVKLVAFNITGDGASYNIHGNLESITLTAEQAQRAGEKMIALEQRIAALESQLAEARRQNELLRAVAEAAKAITYVPCGLTFTVKGKVNFDEKYQAAIDGGALDATQPPD